MKALNRFMVVLIFVALIALFLDKAFAGTERLHNEPRVKVDVCLKGKLEWTCRTSLVYKFDDARIVMCIETINSAMAECLVILNDHTAQTVKVRLLEDKT